MLTFVRNKDSIDKKISDGQKKIYIYIYFEIAVAATLEEKKDQ